MKEIANIHQKILANTATNKEIDTYLSFIINSSPKNEIKIKEMASEMGFNNLEVYKEYLHESKKSSQGNDSLKLLALIGGAVLLAFFISKK